jgi:hypothetical protein
MKASQNEWTRALFGNLFRDLAFVFVGIIVLLVVLLVI